MSLTEIIDAYEATGRCAHFRRKLRTISLNGGKALPIAEATKRMLEAIEENQKQAALRAADILLD